MVATL